MASRNPPVKRKNYTKVKGKYALPEQAAIINVAGEVFVLNTNIVNKFTGTDTKDNESFNYSSYYDQALKGDDAFNEFFLSVFDTMKELVVNDKTVFKIDTDEKRAEIKARAKLIYILLFPFKTLAGDTKVKGKKPCSGRDYQILMQTLFYRRNKLKEQITDYNNISTGDMKARYLRDHLLFLNKLIEQEIPQTIECDNIEGILSGKQNPIFGNLSDENIKQLLTIFAYLLAQGRNPLDFFASSNPNPGTILLDMGKKGAPTLQQYLDQIKVQGLDEKEYVKKEFTPTMVKLRDIIYGTDIESQLSILETDYGMPNQMNKTIEERIENLLKAKKDMQKTLEDKTDKANQELKDTQDIAIDVIQDLKKQIELRGAVSGILKYLVSEDNDLRDYTKKLKKFMNVISEVDNKLEVLDVHIFGYDTFILNITSIFKFMFDDNIHFLKRVAKDLNLDEEFDNKIELTFYEDKELKKIFMSIKSFLLKTANAYNDKLINDKEILNYYLDKNTSYKEELNKINLTTTDFDEKIYKPLYADSLAKINENASKAYKAFIDLKVKFEEVTKEVISKYNTIYQEKIDFVNILDFSKTTNLKQEINGADKLNDLVPETIGALLPNAIIPKLPQLPSQNSPFIYRQFSMTPPDNDILPSFTPAVDGSIYELIEDNIRSLNNDITDDKFDDIRAIKSTKSSAKKTKDYYVQGHEKLLDLAYSVKKLAILQLNFYYARFFYKKMRFTQESIVKTTNLEIFAQDSIPTKKQKIASINGLVIRSECELYALENLKKSSIRTIAILKPQVQQSGGGSQNLPIASPKLIKRMVRQMKNNVLSGEVVDEEENLESLMEIYGEQTVDSTLGICSLSMLFLLLETNLMKKNMNELREAIYTPLESLQKDKAYEFLQDFFSSFQDLDHSSQLSFQLKKETLDISKDATKQAKEILTSMFSIDSAPTQYANEFIVFLQLVRTVLEENSHILEELGCLIPT